MKLGWLWLALLTWAWMLAAGAHDLLGHDHEHESNAPELSLAQAWTTQPDSCGPTMAMPVAVLVVFLLLVAVPTVRELPRTPHENQARPRPPTSGTSWSRRGPPARTLRCLQSHVSGRKLVQNLSTGVGAGVATPGPAFGPA